MNSTLLLCHKAHLCIFLPSTTGTPLFLLSGRSRFPTRKLQFPRFRVVHWAVQILFIPISSLNPPCISINKYYSSFTLFPGASLSLLSTLSFTSVLFLPNFSMDGISSWLPLLSFHAFSTTLPHLIVGGRLEVCSCQGVIGG